MALCRAEELIYRAMLAGDLETMEQLAAASNDQGCVDWVRFHAMDMAGNGRAAVMFLKKAVDGNCSYAINTLAKLYRSGTLGLPRDRGKAIQLAERSARMGNVCAMEACFELYLGERKGYPRNEERAQYWLEQGAGAGSVTLKRLLDEHGSAAAVVAALDSVTLRDLVEIMLEGDGKPLVRGMIQWCLDDGLQQSPWVLNELKALHDEYASPELAAVLCLMFVSYDIPAERDEVHYYFKKALPVAEEACARALCVVMSESDKFGLFEDYRRVADELAALKTGRGLMLAAGLLFDSNFPQRNALASRDTDSTSWPEIHQGVAWLEDGMALGHGECRVALAKILLGRLWEEPGTTSEQAIAMWRRAFRLLGEEIARGNVDAVEVYMMATQEQIQAALSKAELMDMLKKAVLITPMDGANDYIRVELLLELGELCVMEQGEKVQRMGKRYLREARDIATAGDILDNSGEVLVEIGHVFVRAGMFEDATEALEAGAALGSVNALGYLSILILEGENRLLRPKGVRGIRKAAEEGMPEAVCYLGTMLLYGQDVPKDTEQGLRLLDESLQMGCHWAATSLALAYLEGDAVPYSLETAIRYFREGAAMGCAFAVQSLKDLQHNGQTASLSLVKPKAKVVSLFDYRNSRS